MKTTAPVKITAETLIASAEEFESQAAVAEGKVAEAKALQTKFEKTAIYLKSQAERLRKQADEFSGGDGEEMDAEVLAAMEELSNDAADGRSARAGHTNTRKLSDHVMDVINASDVELQLKEITPRVEAGGYITSSKTFGNQVMNVLKELADSGKIIHNKAGRKYGRIVANAAIAESV